MTDGTEEHAVRPSRQPDRGAAGAPGAARRREADRYDVIVVGARCAGSPLAALLARQGVRVALIERASFPRETLSSHIFETDALAFLGRLGVIEKLRATGAPLVARTHMRVEDVELSMDLPQRPGDVGGIASVRRMLLDAILADAAEDAGADLHAATTVTGLLEESGRTVGVRVVGRGGEAELRARLIVGADGRHSTVAKLCGARRYNVTPNQRLSYWAYFEDADMGSEATFLTHRWGDRFVLAIPTDSGLYQVLIWPEMSELDDFRARPDAAFLEHARTCAPIADALGHARLLGKVLGAVRWEGFFREASGRGWVLSGDAGHFKSPAPGRGIGDAFLQADSLAAALGAALGGSDEELDEAMARWGRKRDREFAEHYWLAGDLEDPGPVPAVLTEILRGLSRRGQADLFLELLSHRARPSQVLSPPRVLAATGRLLGRDGIDRRAVLSEIGSLGARDMRRRWLNRRPAYAAEQRQPGSGVSGDGAADDADERLPLSLGS
jgi:flavin-dependent dehydrogenase